MAKYRVTWAMDKIVESGTPEGAIKRAICCVAAGEYFSGFENTITKEAAAELLEEKNLETKGIIG